MLMHFHILVHPYINTNQGLRPSTSPTPDQSGYPSNSQPYFPSNYPVSQVNPRQFQLRVSTSVPPKSWSDDDCETVPTLFNSVCLSNLLVRPGTSETWSGRLTIFNTDFLDDSCISPAMINSSSIWACISYTSSAHGSRDMGTHSIGFLEIEDQVQFAHLRISTS